MDGLRKILKEVEKSRIGRIIEGVAGVTLGLYGPSEIAGSIGYSLETGEPIKPRLASTVANGIQYLTTHPEVLENYARGAAKVGAKAGVVGLATGSMLAGVYLLARAIDD